MKKYLAKSKLKLRSLPRPTTNQMFYMKLLILLELKTQALIFQSF